MLASAIAPTKRTLRFGEAYLKHRALGKYAARKRCGADRLSTASFADAFNGERMEWGL